MTTPSEPPLRDETKAPPLVLELPAPAAAAQDRAAPGSRPRSAGRRGRTVVAWIVVALLGIATAGAVGAAVLLPRWVRDRFVEAAAARGIALHVEGATIERGGFRLVGLRATCEDLPGAVATAPELDVETTGLQPTRLRVRGGELSLSGPLARVEAALSRWRSRAVAQGGADWTPTEIVVDESHLVWQQALGESGRVEAANAHLDLSFATEPPGLHARSDRVTLALPAGTLGPWRLDLDRSPGTSRARVALDPGVPDACTILVVGNDERTTHVDVVVPRSPPQRLGLPAELFGLHGKDLQLEVTVRYSDLGGAHGEASARGGLHGIEAGGLPHPIDVSWEGSATGDPRQGMDVRKARVAVGPLVGSATGTVKAFDDGFRVNLAWSAGPVPCAAFDAPLGQGEPFDIAYQLRRLAEATGLTRLAGDVSARAEATLDSRDLASARLTFTPQVQCQVALFGR